MQPPSEEIVISLENVTFGYGVTPALVDVNLQIHNLESVCIVGPNGGGKTTLLKLILGLLSPDVGEVRLFGQPPERTRRRSGYMPQRVDYDLQFPMTVLDIVLLGRIERRWGWRYSRADREAARAALAEVGLAGQENRPFSALSGGQRQRALIARALATEPDLLLLDEPTAHLDIAVEEKLFEILRELNRRMTILLVSHDLGFVSNVVDTVVCVNRRVVLHPTSELTGESIQDIYSNAIRIVRHDRACEREEPCR